MKNSKMIYVMRELLILVIYGVKKSYYFHPKNTYRRSRFTTSRKTFLPKL